MSERITKFHATVHNAKGEPVTIHLYMGGFTGKHFLEVGNDNVLVFKDPVFPEDLALIDSKALQALMRKLQAYERAKAFVERFGFGLWRGW